MHSYQEARELARQHPGISYLFNAGNGFTGRVYYCTWRKRLIYSQSADGETWF